MNAFTTTAALALLLTSASASAATTFVAPGQGSLQAAIDAAAPGDTLQLGDGTYSGSLVIDKNLIIEGLDYNDSIISCGGADLGVHIMPGADVHLDSLRVTGATSVTAIFVQESAYVELSTVMVTGNTTFHGAIINLGDTLIDENSVISNNHGQATGGGITNLAGYLELDNVTVTGNSGYLGGGLFNSQGSAVITNSSFSGNYAVSLGGGYSNHNHGGSVFFAPSSSFSSNYTGTGNFEACYDINPSAGCVQ